MTKAKVIEEKDLIRMARAACGKVQRIYLHWSGGHYGANEDAYHLCVDRDGQVYVNCSDFSEKKVEEDKVAGKHHDDVQHDSRSSQSVELKTCLTKTLKEAGTHLQTNHKDEENQSEVLYEGQRSTRSGKFRLRAVDLIDVTHYDARKEHEGDTQ